MLKIYPFIIETLRLIAPLVRQIEKRDCDLARQLRRAASSIALDVAEVFDHVETIDEVLRDRLDRIAATLYRLTS